MFSLSLAVWEKLINHFDNSIFKKWNPNFWDPAISWKRKYKEGDPAKGPKFLFSSTFLTWITDAYHLIKSIMVFIIILGFQIVLGYNIVTGAIISLLIYTLTFGLAFNLFLDKNTTIKQYISNKFVDFKSFIILSWGQIVKLFKKITNKKKSKDGK